jgi:hypothetical protein
VIGKQPRVVGVVESVLPIRAVAHHIWNDSSDAIPVYERGF